MPNSTFVQDEFDLSIPSNHIKMAKYIHRKYSVNDTKYKLVSQDSNSSFMLSSECSETTGHKIKKMMTLDDYDDYVYDLTTDNHHFAAGI